MERYKSREQFDALLAKFKTDLRALVPGIDGITSFDVRVSVPIWLESPNAYGPQLEPFPSDNGGQLYLRDRADKSEATA